MTATNGEVISLWADHLAKHGKQPPRKTGGTVRILEDGTITYERFSGRKRLAWGPVTLGIYAEKHKTIVLNGDGFTDQNATNWQTRLRGVVHRTALTNENAMFDQFVVIPYAALTAAGVDVTSIIALDVLRDEIEVIWHEVEEPDESKIVFDVEKNKQMSSRTTTWIQNDVTYRCTERGKNGYYTPDDGEWPHKENQPRKVGDRYGIVGWIRDRNSITVFAESEDLNNAQRIIAQHDEKTFKINAHQRERLNIQVANSGNGMLRVGDIPTKPGWYWSEEVHHLGACLFSALGEDGKRHKFVSAFDRDERTRMYFLAQLPDRSGAKTFQEGIDALAPPFVHQAREQGRVVRRQGDVFAVETNLTDEVVYALARTRVRRSVALYHEDAQVMTQVIIGARKEPEVLPGEVVEKIDCPLCRCGNKRKIGWGPAARRALMIYATGHTATEVVVSKKGVTYIRGIMHHDPSLETPGRDREHMDVPLPGSKWFVAVRNTVPRRKRRVEREEVANA